MCHCLSLDAARGLALVSFIAHNFKTCVDELFFIAQALKTCADELSSITQA